MANNENANDKRYHEVVGTGGRVRHAGYFSSSNPYFDDMTSARNNKDKDAAYERAVEWEADNANLQEQRAYDKEVLAEQREYDSPLQRLIRDKEAGINSELAGGVGGSSSSGGSSAQLAQREIDDQQPQTKFKNAYDDTAEVFNGLSAAGGFISSIAGGFSAVASGLSTIRQIPSQIKVNEASALQMTSQADLVSAQAGEIRELLSGKKVKQDLSNSSAILQSLLSFGSALTPESDIAPLLSAMGVPAEHHNSYSDAFKELMKNPEKIAQFKRGQVSANRAAAESSIYTVDYFGRITEKAADLHEKQLDFGVIKQGIQNNIANLISASSYAQDTAEAAIVGASNSAEASKLSQQQINRDAEVFVKKLEALKEEVRINEARRVDLLNKEMKDGLNERERIELEFLNDFIPMQHTLGSNELSSMWTISGQVVRNAYLSRLGDGSLNGQGDVLQNLSIYWHDFVNGAKSGNDIANQWVNTVINGAAAVGGLMLGVGVVTKPQQSGQVITESAPGYDGTMQTINQKTIKNVY